MLVLMDMQEPRTIPVSLVDIASRTDFVYDVMMTSSPQRGKVLKEKGAVRLYIERNLYEDFCRDGETGSMRGVCEARLNFACIYISHFVIQLTKA